MTDGVILPPIDLGRIRKPPVPIAFTPSATNSFSRSHYPFNSSFPSHDS